VLAYHLRISFKPGETDAETVNRIGYDFTMNQKLNAHLAWTNAKPMRTLDWIYISHPTPHCRSWLTSLTIADSN
jgi:hypothetical protein